MVPGGVLISSVGFYQAACVLRSILMRSIDFGPKGLFEDSTARTFCVLSLLCIEGKWREAKVPG